jgi:predicted AlkP superfamily pyrophosphatase or phosphodiesterase
MCTVWHNLEQGAGTLNARANLPSVTVPNWAGVLTGAGPSELSISTNSWTRETARSPPVSFDLIRSCVPNEWDPHSCLAKPLDNEPWYPNILEIAKSAGVDVSLFHDWAPLNRIFSSAFVASDDVQTMFCSDDAVRDQYESSLACWDGTDAACIDGAVSAIRDSSQGAAQLVVVHQALVDEVGHALGWGSAAQLEAMATLDARVANLVEAVEEVDPDWDESLLLITAYHGAILE